MERFFAMAAKLEWLERVRILEETSAAWLIGWSPQKSDMIRQRYKARTAVECLNTTLMAAVEEDPGKAIVHSVLVVLRTRLLGLRINGG